ncbi:unnamed protein product [Rhodiola kirilowii]
MSQLATSMSALTIEPGKLPSQTIQNQKGNVNVVTLRMRKNLSSNPWSTRRTKSRDCPEKNK